jgi:hypothetical protein
MRNFEKLYKQLMNEAEEEQQELQQTEQDLQGQETEVDNTQEQEISSADDIPETAGVPDVQDEDSQVPEEITAKANQIFGAMQSKGATQFSLEEIINLLMLNSDSTKAVEDMEIDEEDDVGAISQQDAEQQLGYGIPKDEEE